MKKKVLIITYYWPPAGGPGVQRWLKFVKYLPEFNIDPIVYIPDNPNYPLLDESLASEIPEKITILKYPIKVGEKWSSQSKTFLIIRRYPYFDYRATTDFEIDYEITSVNETVKVPAGKFNKCIKIEGKGNATFIGDREIGLIKIAIKKSCQWV